MARVKNGTRMSHISLMNVEVDSTWITNHYNGLLNTDDDDDTLLDELGAVLLTEKSLNLELDGIDVGTEITTISFVGDERVTPNSTSGEFNAS